MEQEILFRLRIEAVEAEKELLRCQEAIKATKKELQELDKVSADYEKRLEELSSRLKEMVLEQNRYAKILEQSKADNAAYTEQMSALTGKIAELTAQQAAQLDVIDQTQKANQDLEASNVKLRTELELMAAEYSQLSKAQQENNKVQADAEKEMVRLQKIINATRSELSSLDKNNADYAEQQVRLGAQLKALTKEQGVFRKALEDEAKAAEAAEGSNNQLRAQLSTLTAQYNALSKAQRETTAGVEFQKRIKALSDEIKKNEAAIGDNRRNVGNYASALGNAVPSLKGFTSGIEATGTAFKANPIGFFVDILIKLLMQLKNIQPVMDAVEQATVAFNTAFAVVVDTAAALVKTVKENLAPALSAVGKILKGDVSGFTDLFNIGKKVVNNMAAVASTTLDAGKAAAQLARDTQALNREETRLVEIQAERRKQVFLLKKTLEDASISEAERIANSQKAQDIQQQILDDDLKMQRERVRILAEQQALASNTEADNRKLAEERAKLSEMEAQALGEKQELRNKQAQLQKAQFEEQLKQYKAQRAELKELLKELEKATGIQLKREEELTAAAKNGFDERMKARINASAEQADREAKEHKEKLERQASEAEVEKDHQERLIAGAFGYASTMSDITLLMAEQSAEAAQFGKALSLVTMGFAQSEAIGKGIKDAMGLGFPQNLVAAGATIGIISSLFMKARQMFATEVPKPNISKPSFETGGYTGAGNPTEESRALGPKPYTYHKSEYVIPAPVLETPEGRRLAERAEYLRRYIPRVNVPKGFANGGFTPGSTGPVIDYNQLAKAIAKQPISVSVKEINAVQGRVAQVRDSTSI